MTDETHGGCYSAKPTIRERLWRTLGFCRQYDDALWTWRNMEPPEEGFAPGAFVTDVHIEISFVDRLRVLVTGHVWVEVSTKADVIPKKLESRSRVACLPPMEEAIKARLYKPQR